MAAPADWLQRQRDVFEEYEKSQDQYPYGPLYDQLFGKLICTEMAKSWQDFSSWIGKLHGSWCFRGQRESGWTLRTSFDRAVTVVIPHGHYPLNRSNVEDEMLFRFQQQAHQFIPHLPSAEDKLSWFALMQHHGAPTRLLDWTLSPFVALYFAVEEAAREFNDEQKQGNTESDDGYSAVWALNLDWLETQKENYLESLSPESQNAVRNGLLDQREVPLIVRVDPRQASQRMAAQQGMFLWKMYKDVPFFDQILISMIRKSMQQQPVIKKLKLGKNLRIEFLQTLRSMNIHRASLFPGLDGFGKSLSTNLEIEVANESQRSRS
jgi:hypothetical protein